MCQPYLGLCFVNATYQSQTGVSLPNNNAWNLKIKKLAIVGQPLNQKTKTIQCSMVMSHETPPWPVFSPDTYARNPPVSRCRSANRALRIHAPSSENPGRLVFQCIQHASYNTGQWGSDTFATPYQWYERVDWYSSCSQHRHRPAMIL